MNDIALRLSTFPLSYNPLDVWINFNENLQISLSKIHLVNIWRHAVKFGRFLMQKDVVGKLEIKKGNENQLKKNTKD